MHVGQRRLGVRQLDGGDAQRPDVTPDVIAVVVLLLTGDHLARHGTGSAEGPGTARGSAEGHSTARGVSGGTQYSTGGQRRDGPRGRTGMTPPVISGCCEFVTLSSSPQMCQKEDLFYSPNPLQFNWDAEIRIEVVLELN